MASNTKLSWRFTHEDNTSTSRVNTGEISYLTGTAEDITEDNFLTLASIIELEYPVRTDGATPTNHEIISYSLKHTETLCHENSIICIKMALKSTSLSHIMQQ